MIYYGLYLRFSLRLFFVKQNHSISLNQEITILLTDFPPQIFLLQCFSAELYELTRCITVTANASLQPIKHHKIKYTELDAPKGVAGIV